MNNLYEWQKINSQINKMMKPLSTSAKSKINNKIFQKTNSILTEKSLSLIYNKYGEQLYEKTPNIKDYLKCKKSGFQTLIENDDSKLVCVNQTNNFNTDFIPYGSLPNIEKTDVKKNDFIENNNYLYKLREQEERKNSVLTESINEVKIWFNTLGQEEFQKIDSSFVGKLK